MHDAESRAQHPDLFGENANVEKPPTHYADVEGLPTDRVLRLYVTQRSDRNNHVANAHGEEVDHGLAIPIIHIPAEAKARAIAKMKNKRLAARFKSDTGEINTDLLNTYGPADIAKTIVFHHPDIANLDADLAASIMMNYIGTAPGLNDLIYAIKALGQHGWYTMETVKNEDGTDHTFSSDGATMYQYVINDQVLSAAALVVQSVLNAVKNDPALKGHSYHPTAGVGQLDVSDTAGGRKTKDGAYTFRLAKTGFHSGFRTRIADSELDNVELKFRNDWLRHLGVYIQFFDENDNQLSIAESDWTGNLTWLADVTIRGALDADDTKFLSLSSPVPTIFAIPVAGDYTETKVNFDWPPAAHYALVSAGGLGHGGKRDQQIETMGIAMTSVFELGVPTILLGVAVGMPDGGKALNKIMRNTSLTSFAIQFFFSLIWSSSDMDAGTLGAKIGRLMANFLVTGGAQLIVTTIAEYVVEQEIEESIPFCGWILAAANIASTAAQLAEASGEVASSPWIIENKLFPSHDITVTIHRDPDDYQFPATATSYKLVTIFSSSDTRVIERDMPGTTVSEPIVLQMQDVPAGGHVVFNVGFYSDTGWLAGQGQLDVLNVNSDGKDYLDAQITIKENLVPLDENSVYNHKQKLAIDNGAHVWIASEAPTATAHDLSPVEAGNALSELVNININQKTGDIGYVFKAYSSNVLSCANGSSGQLYVYQNISAMQNPDGNLKFSGCGYTDKPYMFYTLGVPDSVQAGSRKLNLPLEQQNFVLLPEDDEFLYVRHVSLETGVDFQVDHTKSYCKFPLRLDAAVVHPHGIIVGINHSSARLFACSLTNDPVADADAPVATMAGAQLQDPDQIDNNPALLAKPVAMALGPEGAILVLDNIEDVTTDNVKAAVRAFNPDGTPLAYFGDSVCVCDEGYSLDPEDPTSCIDPTVEDHNGPGGICGGHGHYNAGAFVLNLKEEPGAATYLDIGVEHKGYIYVLSYGDDGDSASDYRMDIYQPNGQWLVRTTDIPAGRLTVDLWRNVYTLNYELLVGPDSRTEPSVSEWIPPTPPADGDDE
ncbi:MAG: hypothetical protein C4523_20945 [Myxococcales bacterium]|nr:MAG: hypothetical protein C4523_20945 [Myxococcales bacterium]